MTLSRGRQLRRMVPSGLAAATLLGFSGAPRDVLAQSQLLGPEFQVNSYTQGDQSDPVVASRGGGDFVVVWRSAAQEGAAPGIYAQRFLSDGSASGGEFAVHSASAFDHYGPAAASAPSGSFVVAWSSVSESSSLPAILGRRFSAEGSPEGEAFAISVSTTGQPARVAIASDGLGGFIATWQDEEVLLRRFDVSGAPLSGEVQANSTTFDMQGDPAVAASASGEFVVVWESYGQDGSSYGVFGQRFDATGSAAGSEFQINSDTTSWQVTPAVAMAESGEFVVAWIRDHPGSGGSDVVMQRFDANAVPIGAETQVSGVSSGFKGRPSVAIEDSGGFVVGWDAPGIDGSSAAVVARRFDADGVPIADEFRVNTYTLAFQGAVKIARGANDSFVMTWNSDSGQDGSEAGVFAQRIALPPFVDGFESGDTCFWDARVGSGDACKQSPVASGP